MEWIAFCSQTGGEIKRVSDSIKEIPSCIVTNNKEKLSEQVLEWIDAQSIQLITLPSNPQTLDYFSVPIPCFSKAIVTLHGYTRIIPSQIISAYPTIYNGHPGLISKYPELKGFNPQKRAFEGKYNEIGSVLHKVIDEVDEGEIICESSSQIDVNTSSLNNYFITLQQHSFITWLNFFTNKLYLNK